MATASKGWNEAGNVFVYDADINQSYTTGVWKNCPLRAFATDPSIGSMWRADWGSYDEANTITWVSTSATTGATAVSVAAPGVLEIDSGATTQGQGENVQGDNFVFVPAAGKHIWAEFNFKIVDTFDDCEIFVGLSEVDVTVLVSQANTSTNYVGWECVTNDGVLLFEAEKAGQTVTGKTSTTIAEATYVKLGFYINGVTDITHYVNDVVVSTTHVTAQIPVVKLVPTFVCQAGGTADPIMHVGACQVFQLR